MGLDGFSMGNLGLNAELTSAQMATQAEQLAMKESEIKIKDVTKMAEDAGVKRKDEDSENKNPFEDNLSDNQESDENKGKDEKNDKSAEKFFESKNPRDFSLRINYTTELIELYNNKEEDVLETINATDLMNVISRLDNPSGILVNRKI